MHHRTHLGDSEHGFNVIGPADVSFHVKAAAMSGIVKVVLCLIAATLSRVAIAEHGPSGVVTDPCDRYKITFIQPPANVDFRLTVVTPPSGVHHKLRVIDPCQEAGPIMSLRHQGIAPQDRLRFPNGR